MVTSGTEPDLPVWLAKQNHLRVALLLLEKVQKYRGTALLGSGESASLRRSGGKRQEAAADGGAPGAAGPAEEGGVPGGERAAPVPLAEAPQGVS